MKFLIVLSLIALASAFPKQTKRPRLDGRIVGGQDANIDDYPYTVQLTSFGSQFCGGSIISENYVVTAAHCTDGSSARSIVVLYGNSILNNGQSIGVAEINQHPQYDPISVDYDISILKLDGTLSLSNSAQPINLPAANKEWSVGTTCTVTGWGYKEEGGSSANQLQVVQVPLVSNNECDGAYGGGITARMMCAGVPDGGKDSCQGDSGGPLAIDGELAGIVSWGFGCARPGYPGVYSRVATLRDYITLITGL